jgi:hypothetical protein
MSSRYSLATVVLALAACSQSEKPPVSPPPQIQTSAVVPTTVPSPEQIQSTLAVAPEPSIALAPPEDAAPSPTPSQQTAPYTMYTDSNGKAVFQIIGKPKHRSLNVPPATFPDLSQPPEAAATDAPRIPICEECGEEAYPTDLTDTQSGNTYRVTHRLDGSTELYGINVRTGAVWSTSYAPNGSMRGIDKHGNVWSYDAVTGNYLNSNGAMCFGHKPNRICSGP